MDKAGLRHWTLPVARFIKGPKEGRSYTPDRAAELRVEKATNVQDAPSEEVLTRIESRAIDMARGAGEILTRYFGGKLEVSYKDEREKNPVTNVDTESQEYLEKEIAKHFPGHGVLGEENGDDDNDDGETAPDFVWVLDPLDGTKNFISGLPVYACSIGVIYRGAPLVGAVFVPWPHPSGGVVFHARRGGGARVDGESISVLLSDRPKDNQLVTLPSSFYGFFRFRKPMRGKVGELRVTGSIAYELAMTACGVLQYSLVTSPQLWDVAGGVALVLEAGGDAMVGHRAKRLRLFPTMRWEPLGSFVPSWHSGVTTMKELRRWSSPMLFGSPGVARFVASTLELR